ncbi:hypothetical protein SDC9_125363 [bioreactor metagenome]|uniref:Uncharacterized protein n=1 Tax=bioreactor metagenome TaxID=1076179 RepID=A0A645CNK3_9ZZZZ
MGRQAGDVLLVEEHLAGGRYIQSGHVVEQRGLACPVGTDEAGNEAALNHEINLVHGDNAAVGSGQCFCFQEDHCAPPLWPFATFFP